MSILVDVKKYLALEESPKYVQDYLSVAVTDHAYLPKTEDITSDWVAYIAAPAFKLIRENLGHDVETFASIGTGSGIDVLTGIELLGAKRVGFTDLQKSVVTAAAENIKKNLKNADSIELEFGAGDLLQPLENGKRRYDVIYENLANVPLTDNTKIEDKRNSGHYLEARRSDSGLRCTRKGGPRAVPILPRERLAKSIRRYFGEGIRQERFQNRKVA